MAVDEAIIKARASSVGIEFYCDGAVHHNGRPDGRGGWGLISVLKNGKVYDSVRHKLLGPVVTVEAHPEYIGAERQTNQTAELSAMYWALKLAEKVSAALSILVVSDSMYALNLTQLKWVPKTNVQLARQCYCAYINNPNQARISFQHVRGHSGNVFNELADELAKIGVWEIKTVRRK